MVPVHLAQGEFHSQIGNQGNPVNNICLQANTFTKSQCIQLITIKRRRGRNTASCTSSSYTTAKKYPYYYNYVCWTFQYNAISFYSAKVQIFFQCHKYRPYVYHSFDLHQEETSYQPFSFIFLCVFAHNCYLCIVNRTNRHKKSSF